MLRRASGPCTMGLIDDSAVSSISEMHWKEGRTGRGGGVVKNKEWEGKQGMKLEEDRGTLWFSTGYRNQGVLLPEAWNESRSLERTSD